STPRFRFLREVASPLYDHPFQQDFAIDSYCFVSGEPKDWCGVTRFGPVSRSFALTNDNSGKVHGAEPVGTVSLPQVLRTVVIDQIESEVLEISTCFLRAQTKYPRLPH